MTSTVPRIVNPPGNPLLLRKHFRDLNNYQDLAIATRVAEPDAMYSAAQLAIQAGRIGEQVDKFIRQNRLLPTVVLTQLLGNALWYIADLADMHGISLENVAKFNLDLLAARYATGEILLHE